MTFSDIVSLVTAKIGETDDYAAQQCLLYCQNRHRYIYDSFDWTASQDFISVTVNSGDNQAPGPDAPGPPLPPNPEPPPNPLPSGFPPNTIEIPAAEKVISARFNGSFIDPVSPSYIFETLPDLLNSTGTPIYFWSKFNQTSHNLNIRLFPSPAVDGIIDLVIKNIFNVSATEPSLPNIEDALIAFVEADMWAFMRQIGKSQAKLTEAEAILQKAQLRDTPAAPKARSSKNLTATGTTLGELTDSVCEVIGKWEPDTRESIRERIRRNYQTLWDMYMLPESLIIANVNISPDQQQVVLPHLFDKFLQARTNVSGPLTVTTPLRHSEIQFFFGIDYNIFEQSGEPLFTYTLLSVAVATLPPFSEQIFCKADASDVGAQLFIKGESVGIEYSESLTVAAISPKGDGPTFYGATSTNVYDTPLTLTKPVTNSPMTFSGAKSGLQLLTLNAPERERKHLRIGLMPTLNPLGASDNIPLPGNILVLGKRQLSPLVDDNDSPQLRNISNILIAGAAGDMFDRLGSADMATKYQAKATTLTQVLVDAEMKQNAYQPTIVPWTEGDRFSIGGVTDLSSSDLTAITFP